MKHIFHQRHNLSDTFSETVVCSWNLSMIGLLITQLPTDCMQRSDELVYPDPNSFNGCYWNGALFVHVSGGAARITEGLELIDREFSECHHLISLSMVLKDLN